MSLYDLAECKAKLSEAEGKLAEVDRVVASLRARVQELQAGQAGFTKLCNAQDEELVELGVLAEPLGGEGGT